MRTNASIARSSCSRVCAALIWVRMRAWPFGDDREEETDRVDAFFQQAFGETLRQRRVVQHHRADRVHAGRMSKPASVMRVRKWAVFSRSRSRSSPADNSISNALMPAATTCGGNELENR
jgi:hypothetical protein